ncbi:ATP-binding protein [Arcicella rigui]|uniref:ATP-binding protein n=1 Tax=Arcicella rigui TaxID=797020 RepID=A0ABU5QDC0_9BACT|nr:ATP-binding protein [Arcicella rigui]MEA5140834.1 ATP-binding protein [Arcicella rigui]
MKVTELYIQEYNQFKDFRLDLTYPEGHPKAGQALEKVCFIGQSGTGKTSLIEILKETLLVIANQSFISYSILEDVTIPATTSFENSRIDITNHETHISFDNKLQVKFYGYEEENEAIDGEKSFFMTFIGLDYNMVNFLIDEFKVLFYPSNIELLKAEKLSKDKNKTSINKNLLDFSKYDLQSSWSTINEAIIKDRELEIKKSLELSKLLQNPNISQKEVFKARDEFLAWRELSPNPIIDLANNFLNKILNRFNLKVKTELDFEKTEDIETIKIQTKQGKDIPFEGLSTGTKQVILTALPLYGLKPEKSIILFDEPERSLYPDIQAEIVNFYTSMAKDSQFFFATHSPLVASSFEPWEIVELKFNDEGYVYQELYYDKKKGRHVDNYTINPQYLTWTGILQKVFDLDQEGNDLRNKQLVRIATLESQLKHNHLSLEEKKVKFEEYKKLATLLNWELK